MRDIVLQICFAAGIGLSLALMQERTYRLRRVAAHGTSQLLDNLNNNARRPSTMSTTHLTSTQLTPAGRVWAEKNAETSIVANVALHGEGWPTPFVNASRATANDEGALILSSHVSKAQA